MPATTPPREPALNQTQGVIARPSSERIAREIPRLESGDRFERQDAAHWLATLGADARPALPALVHALNRVQPDENEACVWIVRALLGIGPSAAADTVPALIRMMQARSGLADDRCAAEPDGSMSKLGEAAGPPAVELLGGRYSGAALDMLRFVGADALPAAVARLSDPVRARDLGVYLTSLGPAAAPAIPAWIATWEAGHVSRELFIEVVDSIGPGVDPSTRAAIDAALRKRPI